MPPPLLVIRMVQERDLLAVELLVIQTATILESRDVNQPLEVGNEFCADEELVCSGDFLLENFLERAGRAGNQIAHIGQLAEHEIVQCGEQLVELGGIGSLGVVRTSPQIIHLVAFQPPVLDAACRQRNISERTRQDVLRSTKSVNSPSARTNFAVSEAGSFCLVNTCSAATPWRGNIRRMPPPGAEGYSRHSGCSVPRRASRADRPKSLWHSSILPAGNSVFAPRGVEKMA